MSATQFMVKKTNKKAPPKRPVAAKVQAAEKAAKSTKPATAGKKEWIKEAAASEPVKVVINEMTQQEKDEAEATRQNEASTKGKATVAIWLFDQSKADTLYEAVQEAAMTAVEQEYTATNAKKNFAFAMYDLITTIMPLDELSALKLTMAEKKEKGQIALPQNVIDFLRAKQLPLPHFSSQNPFQGICKQVWENAEAALDNKLGKAQLEDEETATKGAREKSRSIYFTQILAAIDMGNRAVITKGINNALKDYQEFKKTNPTLALPSPRKGKVDDADAVEDKRLADEKKSEDQKLIDAQKNINNTTNPLDGGNSGTDDNPFDDEDERPIVKADRPSPNIPQVDGTSTEIEPYALPSTPPLLSSEPELPKQTTPAEPEPIYFPPEREIYMSETLHLELEKLGKGTIEFVLHDRKIYAVGIYTETKRR